MTGLEKINELRGENWPAVDDRKATSSRCVGDKRGKGREREKEKKEVTEDASSTVLTCEVGLGERVLAARRSALLSTTLRATRQRGYNGHNGGPMRIRSLPMLESASASCVIAPVAVTFPS